MSARTPRVNRRFTKPEEDARWLCRLRALRPDRAAKVRALRLAIATESYDLDERIGRIVEPMIRAACRPGAPAVQRSRPIEP